MRLKTLKQGSPVVAGTILGRIGKTTQRSAPHTLFEIRPAGRGAPRIDPKPILDGWKLLESTAIYRAAGKNPFFGSDSDAPSIGQILLMSKEALAERVVNNPRIEIYGCGRRDVQTGQIDRRVLATLEFLAASGFKPTVTSLKCGHSLMTASGNVSEHSIGSAVDIAAVNGIPIVGHQGAGLDHRADDPAAADAAGHDEAAPDHLADEVRQHGQHVRDGRPRGPHPRRLPLALRQQLEDRQAGQRDPQAQAVDQAHRPARRDRQPDRAPHAVALLARRQEARPRVATPTRASSRRADAPVP